MTQVTIPVDLGGSGNPYSDDGTTAQDMRNGGHRTYLLPMASETIAAVETAVTAAGAAVGGAATQATSTTSLTIGIASQALTVQAGKNFVIGMPVRIANSATNWMDGVVTAYNSGAGALTVNAISISGSGTFAAWSVFLVGQAAAAVAIVPSARSSNTILGTADRSALILATSTWTQTFTAAATLGNGWFCILHNAGTGDITLDPNGSEQIDGLASYVMYPGEARLITCNGTGFTSVILQAYRREFTAGATWSKPPGYKHHGSRIWSAGSSGQKSGSTGTRSDGGAGGGCFDSLIPDGKLGATETITVGAGGAAVTGTADGNPGGNSSIGTVAIVYGSPLYNQGGSVASGLIAAAGSPPRGFEGANFSSNSTQASVSSLWGGAAPANTAAAPSGNSVAGGAAGGSLDSSATLRAPGTSLLGGNGGAASSTGNGTAGVAPGGGGGATQTGGSSGAGARGQVDMWGVI